MPHSEFRATSSSTPGTLTPCGPVINASNALPSQVVDGALFSFRCNVQWYHKGAKWLICKTLQRVRQFRPKQRALPIKPRDDKINSSRISSYYVLPASSLKQTCYVMQLHESGALVFHYHAHQDNAKRPSTTAYITMQWDHHQELHFHSRRLLL
eukprot:3144410-Amphidinium_carterae.1